MIRFNDKHLLCSVVLAFYGSQHYLVDPSTICSFSTYLDSLKVQRSKWLLTDVNNLTDEIYHFKVAIDLDLYIIQAQGHKDTK